MKKIALALGSGGARALAHIGVLKAFQRQRIPVDFIVGASMGAILGAHYALFGDAAKLQEAANILIQTKELKGLEKLAKGSEPEDKKFIIQNLASFCGLGRAKKNLVDPSLVEPLIRALVGDRKFEDAKTPFVCSCVDISSGAEVILNKGPLLEALLASSAIPGVFAIIEKENRLLVDGGIISTVPVDAAKKTGADLVIAVDVGIGGPLNKFNDGIDAIFQTDYFRAVELDRIKLSSADIVIEPDVREISWASFSKAGYCIKKGEEAAERSLKSITSRL